jgi:hypothetical protein
MQSALDRNTLDRLISLGRKQGHLTTEDLRTSLPINSMSAEEIALIVVHLEEAGIPVELDDSLISADPKPKPIPAIGAEIIPFPGRAGEPDKSKLNVTALQAVTLPIPDGGRQSPRTHAVPAVHWIVATAGLLALVVLGLIIFASGS